MQKQLCMASVGRRRGFAHPAYFFNNGCPITLHVRRSKILLDPDQHDEHAKRVMADSDPSGFFPAAAGLGHLILRLLAKGPNYPSMMARELAIYHQAVYYHMNK